VIKKTTTRKSRKGEKTPSGKETGSRELLLTKQDLLRQIVA